MKKNPNYSTQQSKSYEFVCKWGHHDELTRKNKNLVFVCAYVLRSVGLHASLRDYMLGSNPR